MMNESLGEVVFTSTTEIVGQCLDAECVPPYGSFIQSGRGTRCVAVVYNLETTSLDPNRRPSALGIPEEDIPRMYPQLAGLLRIEFHALMIGSMDDDRFRYGLPPSPPPLHAEIRSCSNDDIAMIADQPDFLRLLFAAGKSSVEELLLNACHHLLSPMQEKREHAVRIGKSLSDIFRDDYDTLRRIIGRLETGLPS